MQKIQLELKNTPTDTSLVCSSVSPTLNMEEIPSVQDKVLDCIILEENLQQHGAGQKSRLSDIVYVLNMRGQPLMPCKHKKAKQLMKEKKATVVKRFPFTIQLTSATGETKQDIALGVDPGFENVGLSAVNSNKELFSAEVKLRTNISELLKEKTMYRRGRRNRLQYRPARWNNRANAKKEGRLMPSVQHNLDTHLNLINRVKSFLPITKVIVEVCNFDIQKIKNPDIKGKEYQDGGTKGFENIKAYILSRDSHTCQCQNCKNSKKLKLNVHHIIHRADGGTDMPDNLITLCEKCHKDYHNGKINLNFKHTRGFKLETIMSTVKNKIIEKSNASATFGYITKSKRIEIGLEKNHNNDAFIIAGGENQARSNIFNIIQKRRNNRCLQLNRKGFKPSIRKQRYKIQPKDLVKINGEYLETSGVHCNGTRIMINKKSINIKSIEEVYNFGNLIWRSASHQLS